MAFAKYDKIRGFTIKTVKSNHYIYVFEYRKANQTNEERKNRKDDNYTAVEQVSLGNLSKVENQMKLLSFLQKKRGYTSEEAGEIIKDVLFQFYGDY